MSAAILALALCFAGIFCLTPLSIYLIWLTNINRRPIPVVVSGRWDFISLVGGLSGFLIFGALIVMTALLSNVRYWTRGNFAQLKSAWAVENQMWLMVAGIYFGVVLLAVFVVILLRRNSLSVYGVELESMLETVDAELKGLVKGVTRIGYAWPGYVELQPFLSLGHVFVKITATDNNVANEIELRLRRAVPHAHPAPTSPAGWIQSAALASGIGSLCSFGLVIMYLYFLQR